MYSYTAAYIYIYGLGWFWECESSQSTQVDQLVSVVCDASSAFKKMLFCMHFCGYFTYVWSHAIVGVLRNSSLWLQYYFSKCHLWVWLTQCNYQLACMTLWLLPRNYPLLEVRMLQPSLAIASPTSCRCISSPAPRKLDEIHPVLQEVGLAIARLAAKANQLAPTTHLWLS